MVDWIDVGHLDDIPRLGARTVATAQGEIALFRTGDDNVFALHNRCPHKAGPLSEGIVHGHKVTCPLHNWVIELESGAAVAPDVGCAPKLPVKVEEGRIWLQLGIRLKVVHG
ncbi:MAG TPA: nitrite reductase small subunit NirD [Telmatospirillum sp.]|nr:nitrite reductase small subunit NirD [Telmatospirillum sp.]